MSKMIALYVKYFLQQPAKKFLCDSQGHLFGVTTATSLILKRPLLCRRSGSSSVMFRIFGKMHAIFVKIFILKVKKNVFKTQFFALLALHFHFKFNKSKNSKGFELVTREKIKPFLLQWRYKLVTPRNSHVTNRLLQGW